jgi:hypothetical protein
MSSRLEIFSMTVRIQVKAYYQIADLKQVSNVRLAITGEKTKVTVQEN